MHDAPTTATTPTHPARRLVLDPELRGRIVAHLRAALPNEGVALLAAEEAPRPDIRPTRFYPGTNTLQSPVRYQMDWAELVAALRDIDRSGLRLAAIAHSHTRGPARPSATDLAEAWYPDTIMLIASFAAEPPDLRAWALDGEPGAWLPREVPIVHPGQSGPLGGIAVSGNLRE